MGISIFYVDEEGHRHNVTPGQPMRCACGVIMTSENSSRLQGGETIHVQCPLKADKPKAVLAPPVVRKPLPPLVKRAPPIVEPLPPPPVKKPLPPLAQLKKPAALTKASSTTEITALQQQVLDVLSMGAELSIGEMAAKAFGDRPKAQAESWVRNQLRGLLFLGLVEKIARGTYRRKKA